MVKTARQRGLRFGTTAVEGGYGKEPAFLRELDALGERFSVDIHGDQRIYLQNPDPEVPACSRRDKPPTRHQAQCSAQLFDRWVAE